MLNQQEHNCAVRRAQMREKEGRSWKAKAVHAVMHRDQPERLHARSSIKEEYLINGSQWGVIRGAEPPHQVDTATALAAHHRLTPHTNVKVKFS